MKLDIVKTRSSGIPPIRANDTDAGLDLFSPVNVTIPPRGNMMIDFEIAVLLPENTVGLIFARSGLGSKNGIRPRNCVGVIDEKYRDSIKMMVENASEYYYQIQSGDRIAQLVILPVFYPQVNLIEDFGNEEHRGGGFGSTGK